MFMAMNLCAKTLICLDFFFKIDMYIYIYIPWWICYSHMLPVIALVIALAEPSPIFVQINMCSYNQLTRNLINGFFYNYYNYGYDFSVYESDHLVKQISYVAMFTTTWSYIK